MKNIILAVLAIAAIHITPFCLIAAPAVPAAPTPAKPTIFVVGDSTARNTDKARDGRPLAGWGTPIAEFFDAEKVTVKNVAHAGQSSLSYYNGDWPRVLPQIKAGDFVLLVFGINDGTTPNGIGDQTSVGRGGGGAAGPAGATVHTYGWYMAKMTTDAQEKGARVFLLTVTARNMWTNPKVKFTDATPSGPLPGDYDPAADRIERGTGGGRYTQWTKDVGAKLHVPVFDLTNYCADLYEKMGRETVNKLYNDHNHTFVPGAEIVASSIVSGIKAFKNSPFVPLLSEKGKAVEAAAGKYVSDNVAGASATAAMTLPAGTMPGGN